MVEHLKAKGGLIMNSHHFSPLRYPGGKSGLGPWIAHLMRSNGISGGSYVEPYAGGAGVALYLLFNGYVKHITINDADPLIYSFWYAVLNDSESLISKILNTPVCLETWHKQRAIVERQDEHSILDLGYAAFFLNRSNRSGILKGGVIGGLDQSGKYKIDARFNKIDLISRIEKIALHRTNIKLLGVDALKLIQSHKIDNDKRSLIYLDPPYFNKGSQLYRNFYTPEDHSDISNAITEVEAPWLVTYDNCQQIQSLYDTQKTTTFSLTYSTHQTRPTATELMIYGNLRVDKEPELSKSTRPYPRKWDIAV